MKAARLHAIGDFRVDELPTPVPGGKELLLKVGACGVCGSDIPRIFELGTSRQKYPLTIGHEIGGTVVAAGEDADARLIGRRGAVFPLIPCFKCAPCLTADYAMCEDYDYLGSRSDGGFAQYCIVPSAWHFVESKNPATSLDALGMTEPCTVAQHAVRKSNLRPGYSVLILGAGPIGIMAARWARLFGAEAVALVDVVEEKAAFARARGEIVFNSRTQDVAEEFKKLTGGSLADVVIEGTGTAVGQAADCAKTFGTVVLLGNPHKDTVIALKQHSSILRKELRLTGVWNSHFAATPVNEWTYTVAMLDAGKLAVDDLITHRAALDELPGLVKDIYERRVTICKAMYSAGARQ
ncbi:MAG TPA: galactitol-1-phosphate 5-dehydrogenase [Feifaniaceae bacterium]|nr:galactitol-1-phosphate 5-dehydrogenase [Feifaniaceae bacterium]